MSCWHHFHLASLKRNCTYEYTCASFNFSSFISHKNRRYLNILAKVQEVLSNFWSTSVIVLIVFTFGVRFVSFWGATSGVEPRFRRRLLLCVRSECDLWPPASLLSLCVTFSPRSSVKTFPILSSDEQRVFETFQQNCFVFLTLWKLMRLENLNLDLNSIFSETL